MFFSQDILQRRGGKFGIIWIAATKATKLSRRDYCTVNIRKTCADLIAYIMLQAQPTRDGGPRPRFSLYLSSQLMIGVVRVYEKQQTYLLMDATSLSSRCHLVTAPIFDIDMKEPTKADMVTLVDIVESFRGPNDAPPADPCFGLLKSIDLTSWNLIPEVDVWYPPSPTLELSISPDMGRKDILFPSPKTPEPFRPEFGSSLQVARETITLIEDQHPIDLIQIPEQDLPPLQEDELQILIDINDPLEEINPPQDGISSDLDLPQQPSTDAEIKEPSSSPRFSGELAKDLEDLIPQDVQNLEPIVQSPPHTPEQIHDEHISKKQKKRRASEFAMDLSPASITPSASIQKRRKQLSFIVDTEMQITRQQMRSNMQQGVNTSEDFAPAGFPIETAKELLSQPTQKGFRSRRLIHLWQRNAVSLDFPETASDKLRPAWTVPELMIGSQSGSGSDSGSIKDLPLTMGEPPLSPVLELVDEVQREELDSQLLTEQERLASSQVDKSGLDQTNMSVISGREDASHSLLNQSAERETTTSFTKDSGRRSRRRGSSVSQEYSLEQIDKSDDTTVVLEDPSRMNPGLLPTLHEEAEEHHTSPTAPASPKKRRKISVAADEALNTATVHRRFMSHVTALTEVELATIFRHVCPYTQSRQTAACMFTALLNCASFRKINVEQSEPYDEIYIMRGECW